MWVCWQRCLNFVILLTTLCNIIRHFCRSQKYLLISSCLNACLNALKHQTIKCLHICYTLMILVQYIHDLARIFYICLRHIILFNIFNVQWCWNYTFWGFCYLLNICILYLVKGDSSKWCIWAGVVCEATTYQVLKVFGVGMCDGG